MSPTVWLCAGIDRSSASRNALPLDFHAMVKPPHYKSPKYPGCSIINQTRWEGEAFMWRSVRQVFKYMILGFPFYAIPRSMPAEDLSHRTVDPTFLHRYIPGVQPKASDVTTETCAY